MRPRSLLLAIALLAAAALSVPGSAGAAVGVEKVSRVAGSAGDAITLTLGCGFCFPPCHGAPGHREPLPCMLGTKRQPPTAFPISLVPIEKAPLPHRCGPNAVCSPGAAGAPRQAPFTYLGRATPANAEGDTQEPGRSNVPRYRLDFTIPDLPPGTYTYVIFCDVCQAGKSGSLIASPNARPWRLRIPPATESGPQ